MVCVRSVDVYDQLRREILHKNILPNSFINVQYFSETFSVSSVPIRYVVRHFEDDEILHAYHGLQHISSLCVRNKKINCNKADQAYVAALDETKNAFEILKKVGLCAASLFKPHIQRVFNLHIDAISTTCDLPLRISTKSN